jgi:glutamyl-tRNA reductase
VVALRQHFETVRRAELERLLKLSSLPPDVRGRVDEITRLIVEKLLLTPTEQLKSVGDAETVGAYTEALTRLFRLRSQQAATDDADGARPKVVEGPFSRSNDRSSNPGR